MKNRTFSCGKNVVTIVDGFAIDQNVDIAVNSANNGLLLGSSGSERIRKITGYIKEGTPEIDEFLSLCSNLGSLGNSCQRWLKDQEDKPTYVQLECLRILKQNGSKPIPIGKAVLTSSGKLAKPKHIAHAAAMGYTWEANTRGERVKATKESLAGSLQSAIDIFHAVGAKSFAFPLMCTRLDYGVGAETSYNVSLDVISRSDIGEVILCADNKDSRMFIDSIN